MGSLKRSLDEQRGQMVGKAEVGAGACETQLGSWEEAGNVGVRAEPGKEVAAQAGRDRVWRQLDRQAWICTGGKH